MRSWIRRLLTRQRVKDSERKTREVRVQEDIPSERIVSLVQFTIAALVVLAAVEIAHLAVLKTWNAEVFAAITGLVGTVTGVIIGRKT